MAPSRRWITRLTEEATETLPAFPWARGSRRAEFICNRQAQESNQKDAVNG
ncbi:hypothetical protein AAD018_016625 [Aestuariibius insulae]|uniref:hypothetical protein n=1 Tax=Aestuariibius insulae TaxID=2058287 RepID=UPI00345ED9ED